MCIRDRSVSHPRGTHSRYVIGRCLIPLGICGIKNNSRRITYGIGCVWRMPSLSPLSSLGGKLMDSLSSKVIKQIKTVLCCVVNLLARKRLENSKSKEKHRKKSNVSPYSSFVLYLLPVRFTTKTEHSQGFFIC